MRRHFAKILITGLLIPLVPCVTADPQGGPVTQRPIASAPAAPAESDVVFIPDPEVQLTRAGRAVDRFGNEVTSAVATYTLDSGGSLYEEHSPQTELPKLSAPQG